MKEEDDIRDSLAERVKAKKALRTISESENLSDSTTISLDFDLPIESKYDPVSVVKPNRIDWKNEKEKRREMVFAIFASKSIIKQK